jgi:hypothetical protein
MQKRTTDPRLTQPLTASTQQFNPVGGGKKKRRRLLLLLQALKVPPVASSRPTERDRRENVQTHFDSKQKTKMKKKKRGLRTKEK